MSYTYATYQTALAQLMVFQSTADADFVAILPSIIDYAEQRCYRELDLLSATVTDSAAATANTRSFTLPQNQGRFVVPESYSVITPLGAVTANSVRTPLIAVNKEFIDFCWPSDQATAASVTPQYFAPLTDQTILLAPPPGAAFVIEVRGKIRPVPLYTNTTGTWLSLYVPELFIAASMVFASGWMKNFGSQSDNPQMAVSWETQFNTLLKSAEIEEARRRFAGAGWSSHAPEPIAASPR